MKFRLIKVKFSLIKIRSRLIKIRFRLIRFELSFRLTGHKLVRIEMRLLKNGLELFFFTKLTVDELFLRCYGIRM